MSKLLKIATFWALCLLSAMSCTSSADSHRHADDRAVAAAEVAPPAKAQSNGYGPVVWPKLSTAQRLFSGEQMFIDRKDGMWNAWVVSVPKDGRAEAMNFFTDERIEVTFESVDTLPRTFKITDKRGRSWTWEAGSSFLIFDPNDNNSGAMYFGDDRNFIDFRDSLYADGMRGLCPLELRIVSRTPKARETKQNASWSKIPMYFESASEDCPNGKWVSDIGSALDLRDGTMLITLGEYVVRMRFADLSPVGSAPRLRVESARDIRALIRRMESEGSDDPNGYLSRSLEIKQKNP
jgi:hypothetical protein